MRFIKDLSKSVCFILIAAVIAASLSSQIFSQKSIEISGYLVDANDKPLQNGNITVFYDPPLPVASFETLTQVWSPLDDGLFGMDLVWYPGRKIMVLMEDRPEGFYPITNQTALTRQTVFKGVIISKFTRRRNLQRVREYVKYGQVIVDIRNCSDSFVEKIVKSQIHLKLITADGYVASDTSFRPAFFKESKNLVFHIPEGIWYMELIDKTDGRTVLRHTKIAINPSKAVEVSLKP